MISLEESIFRRSISPAILLASSAIFKDSSNSMALTSYQLSCDVATHSHETQTILNTSSIKDVEYIDGVERLNFLPFMT